MEADKIYQNDAVITVSIYERGMAMVTVVQLKGYLPYAVPPRVRVC